MSNGSSLTRRTPLFGYEDSQAQYTHAVYAAKAALRRVKRCGRLFRPTGGMRSRLLPAPVYIRAAGGRPQADRGINDLLAEWTLVSTIFSNFANIHHFLHFRHEKHSRSFDRTVYSHVFNRKII